MYLVKQIIWKHSSQFSILLMRKSVAAYVTLDKLVGLGTTYDVTSRDDCIYMFHGLPVSRITTLSLGRFLCRPLPTCQYFHVTQVCDVKSQSIQTIRLVIPIVKLTSLTEATLFSDLLSNW
jgi:hypothetical protein